MPKWSYLYGRVVCLCLSQQRTNTRLAVLQYVNVGISTNWLSSLSLQSFTKTMGSVDDKPLLSLITGSLSDPSKYVGSSGSEENDTDVQKRSQFWMESHTLSCVQRSSFHSSAEQTFRMTMPPSMLANNNENDNFDMVKEIICGDSCAYVAINGTINDPSNIDNKQYKTAICRQSKGERDGALPLMSNDQVETIGRCAAQFVNNINSQRHQQLGGESNTANIYNNEQNDSAWFRSPIKVAKKLSSVINYAIDSALNMYDDGHFFAATGDGLEGEDVDDAKTDNIDSWRKISFDDDMDDETARKKGGTVSACRRVDEAIDFSDDVISISAVAITCRHLLRFLQTFHADDASSDIFLLCDHRGQVDRIMLERNGWASGSLGSLCRQAGEHFIVNGKDNNASEKEQFTQRGVGKILSSISTEGVNLLAATLCHSNHAIIEKSTITLFPGGITSDLEQPTTKTDHALYQIHLTKIATQNRITRLEKDAETAKKDALSYQNKKMTKVALVHMRRRKAALEEIERCAAVLDNLTAGELRLERAKGDVQLVQNYKLLKEAFQDVRKSSGMENEDVEDLMNDIREEMELANCDALAEGIYNSDAIDEDELNEEFRSLELECENGSPHKTNDVVVKTPSSAHVDAPTESSLDEHTQITPVESTTDGALSIPC